MATTSKDKTPKKTNKKSSKRVPHLYRERDPERHSIKGKFVGLYVIFAMTTLVFAAVSVYLFFFASQILDKYESVDAACRNGNCKIVVNDNLTDEDDSETGE
jgi:nitrogen fixation/metabolism regulation signal transduction histidine kinase